MTSPAGSWRQDEAGCVAFLDFVRAVRVFASRDAGAAVHWLFPASLRTEAQVHDRVHLMVAVGALVAGTLPGVQTSLGRPGEGLVGMLAAQFVVAGADLDGARIGELIAAHCTVASIGVDETLTDVAVELVSVCAPHVATWGGSGG